MSVMQAVGLAQVKGAKPTFDYDPLYGSNPNWTPDMFVEAVYAPLIK